VFLCKAIKGLTCIPCLSGVVSLLNSDECYWNELIYCCNILVCMCETWSLTLREGHRLRVFENRVLRRIIDCKRDEVTAEWRKLHSTELHILYSYPDIVRQIKSRRMTWTVGEVCGTHDKREKTVHGF
jgi:hypothetical protein